MTEKKKREKVVAEISAAHVAELAGEIGRDMTHDEAILFLNKQGRAYEMWKHMMHAGEEYLKETIEREGPYALSRDRHSASGRRMAV
jgi:hypothetical protein